MVRRQPTVLVWKTAWIPSSETFVRDQTAAMTSWTPLKVGGYRIQSTLLDGTEAFLFHEPRVARWGLWWLEVTGRSRRLSKIVRDRNPAIMHAHFARDGMQIRRFARRNKIPLIVTLHGFDITALPRMSGRSGWAYRRNLRKLFRDAAQVIVVSEHIRRTALAHGAPPERTRVVYNGIPVNFEPASPQRQGVLCVGRLVPKKGFADAIRALALLHETGVDATLTIVGDGALRSELTRLAVAASIPVVFTGVLAPEEVRARMAASAVVCVPSMTAPNGDTEGLPTTVLEAALAATPVVAYDHAGIPEAIDHMETGLLVREGDVEALSHAISSLLLNPEWAATLGSKALREVRVKFDVNRRVEDLERVYSTVARLPGPGVDR